MSRVVCAAALLAFASAIAGCGERVRPERSVSARAMQPAWDAAANPFVVPGWKSGDQTGWQQQMTKRAQNQNEYLRVN